jgi:hypothetical protein
LEGPDRNEKLPQWFLPDQLIEALVSLRPRLDAYAEKHKELVAKGAPEILRELPDEDGTPRKDRVYIPEPRLAHHETLALVSDILGRFYPAAAEHLQTAVDRSWIEVKTAHAPGFAKGRCIDKDGSKHTDGRPATIFMTYDGTVNDPVYLIHEAGHYNARALRGTHPVQQDVWTVMSNVVSEAQAFFFQYAFYDLAVDLNGKAELRASIALHQQAEMLVITRILTTDLIGIANRYDVSPSERHTEQGRKRMEDSAWLHWNPHAPGAFIAAALYSRFKGMSEGEKNETLSVFYPSFERFPSNDGRLPPQALMDLCEVTDDSALSRLLQQGADYALARV